MATMADQIASSRISVFVRLFLGLHSYPTRRPKTALPASSQSIVGSGLMLVGAEYNP
ncbi:hypothetical protein ACVWWG_009200 [Bradyrhizobium sp. LB7.2]